MPPEQEKRMSPEETAAYLQRLKDRIENPPPDVHYIEAGWGSICRSCVNKDYTVLARIMHMECRVFRSADLRQVNGREYCSDYQEGNNHPRL
jgi:hypothetical protein